MRRFRNPRYAPESLERKLSPSAAVPVLVAAQVYVPAAGPQIDDGGSTDDDSTGGLELSSLDETDPGEGTDPGGNPDPTPPDPDPTDPDSPGNPETPALQP